MDKEAIPEKLLASKFNLRKPAKKKHKILMLSDHPLSQSGVGTQADLLIRGLIKTEKYSFSCIGGAIKHGSYDPIAVDGSSDYIIKPMDGFGTHDAIRQILLTQRPDAILIFTDPRQFLWLWEIEDEIHEICPIAYWHVWDNDPYPSFNDVWYESTDLINCLAYKTYDLIKPRHPEKTNYIPHAFPESVYFEMPENEIKEWRKKFYGDKADWLIGLWVNRNAHRKMGNDVLNSWKLFLDNLEKEEGHRNALLTMHTDPNDQEGPHLPATIDLLGIQENVVISKDRIPSHGMNIFHNTSDFVINISKAEGFGLSTLISMQVGRPFIGNYTGGIIRQLQDHRDGSWNGIPVMPSARTLTGSQMVPFIYDDHVSYIDVADAMMKMYKLGPEGRKALGQKAKEYAKFEFSYDKMISEWDRTLEKQIQDFKVAKETRKNWKIVPLLVSQKNNMETKVSIPATPTPSPSETTKVSKEEVLEMVKEIIGEGQSQTTAAIKTNKPKIKG